MGTAGWKLQRRKEEELSALSQTTVLLPSYDCHGHPELSGEEAHFIRGRSLSHARDAQLFIFWSKSNRECKLSFIISSKHKRCRKKYPIRNCYFTINYKETAHLNWETKIYCKTYSINLLLFATSKILFCHVCLPSLLREKTIKSKKSYTATCTLST